MGPAEEGLCSNKDFAPDNLASLNGCLTPAKSRFTAEPIVPGKAVGL